MNRVFISQPMKGKTEEEIIKDRESIVNMVRKINPDVEIIESYIHEEPGMESGVKNLPLWYLGESLQMMATADLVVFAKDWKDARGCKIEHDCAIAYDIPLIDMEDENE